MDVIDRTIDKVMADLQIMRNSSERHIDEEPKHSCPVCNDTGWEEYEKTVTHSAGSVSVVSEGGRLKKIGCDLLICHRILANYASAVLILPPTIALIAKMRRETPLKA